MATINGTNASETLDGTADPDEIFGLAGEDTLDGGPGNDTLDGGDDFDWLRFLGASPAVWVDLSQNAVLDDGFGATDTVTGIEAAAGTPGDDTLIGDEAGNALYGADGADQLTGGEGDDILLGDGGNDTIEGGAGADQMHGGEGDDVLIVAAGADNLGLDTIFGEGGHDVLRFTSTTSGDELILGEFVNVESIVIGDAAGDTSGTTPLNVNAAAAGSPSVVGNDGANLIANSIFGSSVIGNGGDDSLFGGGTLDGGDGSDFADYRGFFLGIGVLLDQGVTGVMGGVFNMLVGIENVAGTDQDDILVGDNGANMLLGMDGDDQIVGAGGRDTLAGGGGDDRIGDYPTASVDGGRIVFTADTVVERADEGVDEVETPSSFTLPDHVENLRLFGAPTWRPYEGRGNELDNLILAQGNARFRLYGEAGDDTLDGGDGKDTLDGGAGFDWLQFVAAPGGIWADLSAGLVFNDGGGNVDVLTSIEAILGTGSGDTLAGSPGDNILLADAGNDQVTGGAGDDILSGGPGIDFISGEQGDDVLLIEAGAHHAPGEFIFGGEGTDVVRFTSTTNNDTLVFVHLADVEQVVLGDAAGETIGIHLNVDASALTDGLMLIGNNGWNVLSGTAGGDWIAGNAGEDTLIGGAGVDTLTGGADEDFFVFDTAPSGEQILDFTSGLDHIFLHKSVYSSLDSGIVVAPYVQVGLEAQITATSGNNADGFNDFLKYATDTGNLYYDADGVGPGGLSLIVTLYSDGSAPAGVQFFPTQDVIVFV